MNKMDHLFPKILKKIENLIEDEEGNIPGNRLLMLGTMIIILGNMLAMDVLAAHGSHRSHRSHSSHSSSAHGSHYNHGSHESHVSHQSHTSHSNTASHSNSLFSAEGDINYPAPHISAIHGIDKGSVTTPEGVFDLPDVNQHIETPLDTPQIEIMPVLQVPLATPDVKIETDEIHIPSPTEKMQ